MENPKQSLSIEINADEKTIVQFDNLLDEPKLKPTLSDRKGIKDTIVVGTIMHDVYCYLRDNPAKSFLPSELFDVFKTKRFKSIVSSLSVLKLKGYVFSFPFKVPVGRSASFIYSFSQKSLFKRLWQDTPQPIKKCIFLIESNDKVIYCIEDLIQLTGTTRNQVYSWLNKIYYQRLGLFKIKIIQGLRTFYYNKVMSEETFESLYKTYYKDQILKERRIACLDGRDFEEFSTWTFREYLKLKGINIEWVKCDIEPVDYVGKAKLDISELLSGDKHNEITLVQFVITCKHRNLDRPLGSWYVIGFSGCLREGRSFTGREIFNPRNSVGIIFCTSATSKAYDTCANTGIRIFDIRKLLRMYEIVKERTGQEHRLFEKICLKMEAFREHRKRG